MKNKGGSLYEVLKSASRSAGADDASAPNPETAASAAAEGAQATTLQERLAAYKAAKLAAATQPATSPAIEAAPARTAAATVVLEPDPTPIPAVPRAMSTAVAPASAESEATPTPPEKGHGERVVRLTYNTVLFSGMIAVGLLFIAYAVGLHVGKTHAAADLQPTTEVARPAPRALTPIVPPAPAPQPIVPPPVKKEYQIRLGEWRFVTAQEKVKALALVDDPDLKKSLERAGHKGFEKTINKRGTEDRLALYVDRFSDFNSEAAKSALTAMKTFKFRGQTPFAQAAFEESQPTR